MSDDLKELEQLVSRAKSEASGFVFRGVDRFNVKIKAFQARLGNAFSLMRGYKRMTVEGKTFYNAFHAHWINNELTPEVRAEIERFVDEINEWVKFMEHAGIVADIYWRDMALSLEGVKLDVFNNLEQRAKTADEIAQKGIPFTEIKVEVQSAEGSA